MVPSTGRRMVATTMAAESALIVPERHFGSMHQQCWCMLPRCFVDDLANDLMTTRARTGASSGEAEYYSNNLLTKTCVYCSFREVLVLELNEEPKKRPCCTGVGQIITGNIFQGVPLERGVAD